MAIESSRKQASMTDPSLDWAQHGFSYMLVCTRYTYPYVLSIPLDAPFLEGKAGFIRAYIMCAAPFIDLGSWARRRVALTSDMHKADHLDPTSPPYGALSTTSYCSWLTAGRPPKIS